MKFSFLNICISSFLIFTSCAYTPKKSDQENLKAFDSYASNGDEAGFKKYFDENSYQKSGYGGETVLNLPHNGISGDRRWIEIEQEISSTKKAFPQLIANCKVKSGDNGVICLTSSKIGCLSQRSFADQCYAQKNESSMWELIDGNTLNPKWSSKQDIENYISELKFKITEANKYNDQIKENQKAFVQKNQRRSEQYKNICRKNGWEFVIKATICPVNRFKSDSFWSRTIGISPAGDWVCYNKSKSSKLTYYSSGIAGRDSFAVVEGLSSDVKGGECSIEYVEYGGSVDARTEEGFDTKAPVWRVIPKTNFEGG